MFSTLSKTKIIILSTFISLSANALNLDQSKILSLGKELTSPFPSMFSKAFYIGLFKVGIMSYGVNSLSNKAIADNQFHTFPNNTRLLCVCSISLLKTLWEKEKLLVMSNFSFFLSVFYLL